jgi:hypothetical protein
MFLDGGHTCFVLAIDLGTDGVFKRHPLSRALKVVQRANVSGAGVRLLRPVDLSLFFLARLFRTSNAAPREHQFQFSARFLAGWHAFGRWDSGWDWCHTAHLTLAGGSLI